ncbi:DNA-directed RNA polymerase [Scopulibacillus daqui]|uniref:DNA-directed RNA polymerase n=1 Tax=Scopulibacillus daqui TaxID=1469162 RepID=A0ABS2PVA8_9BACL|nr:sigma-70 family RNA polymerase sigma factor [Scopulibacillus daqui]MBM7643996.1 DNA-directed RNA polymerase [Scopulibacillus daqui]
MDKVQSFEQLAEDYAPLIKKTLVSFHLINDYDEMFQVGLIALWKAHQAFNPDKGCFPSFAKSYIRGELMTALKKKKRFQDKHLFYEGTIADQYMTGGIEDSYFKNAWLEDWTKGLTDRETLWVKGAILNDETAQSIAEKENVSVHTVRSWKKSALKKLRRKFSLA